MGKAANNYKMNYLSIQPSDVEQSEEEKRLFEEKLNQLVGVGLIDVQFVPPSLENLIGGTSYPLERFSNSELLSEQNAGSINEDDVDLAKCNKYLESN